MNRSSVSWWKISLWVALVCATFGFLYMVRAILPPFVLAFLISVLLEPSIQRLQRRGFSRTFSVGTAFLLFLVLLTGVVVTVVPRVSGQLSSFSRSLQSVTAQLAAGDNQSAYIRWNPAVRSQSGALSNPIDQVLDQFSGPLERMGIPSSRRALVQQYVEPHREKIAASVRTFFDSFFSILLNAGSQFFLLLFTPVFVWLMLSDFEQLKVRSATWIPTSIRADTISLVRDVGQVFINYLRGITTSISIYTVIISIVLTVLGVPYAILLALIAGAVYMVPYLGFLISLLSVVLVTGLTGTKGNFFMEFGDPWTFAIACGAVFLAVFFVYDNFVNPRIVGKSVGLSMLVSMFVVFSGATLFGIAGMILALPVAGSVKVMLERLLRLTTTTGAAELKLPATPLRHRSAAEV